MARIVLFALAAACLASLSLAGSEGVFDSNGVKIHYVTEGEGQPLVLIHGWMADTTMWGRDEAGNTKLDATKAQGFQLIALDCRGHGKSDKPLDPARYGPEQAADVVRLLDHLELEQAHLLGYSSGAFIAGAVAATHPERVLSVIFAGQAPLVAGAPASFGEIDVFARIVAQGGDLGEYILAVTPSGQPRPTAEQASAIADYLFAGKDVEALALAGQSFPLLEVTREALARCTAPFLFLHGADESAHVKGRVASVHRLLGRGKVVLIEGGDHMTTLAKPEFSSSVLEFLRSVPGR
jgi:pimeloyl-ACP methyl ester carboxylesterase